MTREGLTPQERHWYDLGAAVAWWYLQSFTADPIELAKAVRAKAELFVACMHVMEGLPEQRPGHFEMMGRLADALPEPSEEHEKVVAEMMASRVGPVTDWHGHDISDLRDGEGDKG